jgi:hypothetical protein
MRNISLHTKHFSFLNFTIKRLHFMRSHFKSHCKKITFHQITFHYRFHWSSEPCCILQKLLSQHSLPSLWSCCSKSDYVIIKKLISNLNDEWKNNIPSRVRRMTGFNRFETSFAAKAGIYIWGNERQTIFLLGKVAFEDARYTTEERDVVTSEPYIWQMVGGRKQQIVSGVITVCA